jgi:hypothetical protein
VGCDDGNACTTDSCDPALGCVFVNRSGACDDGNACTVGEVCSGGSCGGGAPKDCSDGNPCTTDACNPVTGACSLVPNTVACDDGNPCTGTDVCSGGSCSGDVLPDATFCGPGVCCGGVCTPGGC